jgi:hypothetical protein
MLTVGCSERCVDIGCRRRLKNRKSFSDIFKLKIHSEIDPK